MGLGKLDILGKLTKLCSTGKYRNHDGHWAMGILNKFLPLWHHVGFEMDVFQLNIVAGTHTSYMYVVSEQENLAKMVLFQTRKLYLTSSEEVMAG